MPRRRDVRGRDAAEAERDPRRRSTTVFATHGAKSRGEDPARSWERGRFASPALRDTLLDVGVLAETLETATTWAQLPALKRAVTDALTASLTADGTKPIVLCHISHVYPAGASLYFTVVAALTDDPARAVGSGRRMPHPARSEPPAAPSPTTTRWAATTARTSRPRSARSGSRCCAR